LPSVPKSGLGVDCEHAQLRPRSEEVADQVAAGRLADAALGRDDRREVGAGHAPPLAQACLELGFLALAVARHQLQPQPPDADPEAIGHLGAVDARAALQLGAAQ
jgi:hypothetical protein